MRVIAGAAGGRTLRAPAGRATRPTSDRVREAIFSMLTSMDVVEGAAVVDLFAGSGAMGIEALSRGAARATFVDRDPTALAVVRANLAVLGAQRADDATLRRADALTYLADAPAADLVLADPPYAWCRWPELLGALAGRASVVVAESGQALPGTTEWETVRVRHYGTTVVAVMVPGSGRADPSARGEM